jgi:hypothetical protein
VLRLGVERHELVQAVCRGAVCVCCDDSRSCPITAISVCGVSLYHFCWRSLSCGLNANQRQIKKIISINAGIHYMDPYQPPPLIGTLLTHIALRAETPLRNQELPHMIRAAPDHAHRPPPAWLLHHLISGWHSLPRQITASPHRRIRSSTYMCAFHCIRRVVSLFL